MMLAFMVTALTQVNVFAAETVNEETMETAYEDTQSPSDNSKFNENVETVLTDMSSLVTTAVENNAAEEAMENTQNTNTRAKENYSDANLKYLSSIIFCEAGNQSSQSKLAVGNVILNRSANKTTFSHVNTIKDVIYDRKWSVQFTPAYSSVNSLSAALDVYENPGKYSGSWKASTMEECKRAAKEALSGKKAIPNTYYYFNSNVEGTRAKCKSEGRSYTVINSHIYY